MERRQLEYFLAIVDSGSLSGAAVACQATQPTVSQALAGLERELEVSLFHRLPRGVRLTEAGDALVGPAQQAIRDLHSASEAVDRVRRLARGHLEIACPPTLANAPLSGMIGRFRRLHPGVRVTIHAPQTDVPGVSANRLVASGRAEIALSTGDDNPAGLTVLPYGDQELWALLPPGTADPDLEVTPPPSVLRVLELGIVATPRGSTVRNALEDLYGEQVVTESVVVEAAFEEAMIPLVHSGAGACFAPEEMLSDARRIGLVATRTDPLLVRSLTIAHRPVRLSPSAAAFVHLLDEVSQ